MGVGAIFFGDISGNNCRSYRGFAGLETEWQRDSVTGRSVVPPLVWRYLCVQVVARLHGNKYNGAVSGTIAVANNQIRALSAARPPHPRLSFDPLACSLARSLVPRQTLLIAHPLCLNRPAFSTPPLLLQHSFLRYSLSFSFLSDSRVAAILFFPKQSRKIRFEFSE